MTTRPLSSRDWYIREFRKELVLAIRRNPEHPLFEAARAWDDYGHPVYHDGGIPTVPTITIEEAALNPEGQGFIGFIPPKENPVRDITTTARKIAVDLVLLPRESRGSAEYPEEYLQKLAQCRMWPRLRCAYCDCHKSEEDAE